MLYGFYANGVLVGGFPFQLKGEAFSTPVAGVVSETGQVRIYVQTGDGNLDAVSVSDRVERVHGFPLSIGRPSEAAPYVSGQRIVSLSGNGSLKTWGSGNSEAVDARNVVDLSVALQIIPEDVPGGSVASRLLAKNETYNWPNPISEGRTHIRFMTAEDALVTVTIIDGAGSLIKKFDAVPTISNVPTEVLWDTSVGSGLYIARVQAKSVQGKKGDTRLIKMAIVR